MTAQLLIVMMAAIGLTIVAQARRVQAPLLLMIVGMVMSFVPGLPNTEIEPELLLSLVLPPLLFSAALNFSFFSFIRRVGSIANLGIILVSVTAVGVGAVLEQLVPELTLPAALILGAVIAPTDAVSALAIGKQLNLPNRLMTVLKGESLVNDAAALTLFSVAASAATGAESFINNGVLYFLFAAGFGAILGVILGNLVHMVRRHLASGTMVTALTIISPFAAYALSEQLHMSGVMTVVFAGFTLGFHDTDLQFDGRIQQREVFDLIDALLEAFVFAYMGLQFRVVVQAAAAEGNSLPWLTGLVIAALAVVIAIRIFWVTISAWLGRIMYRRRLALSKREPQRPRGPGKRPQSPLAEPLGWKENAVLSWSGMRGVVTVAAAAGTPLLTAAGDPLPGRHLIIAVAFGVAAGTLILQGLTLPWIIDWLKIDSSADATYRKQQLGAARLVIKNAIKTVTEPLRGKGDRQSETRMIEALIGAGAGTLPPTATQKAADFGMDRQQLFQLVRDIHAARRGALIAERNAGRLDDEILRELLENIDLEQAAMARRGEVLLGKDGAEPGTLF